MVNHKSGILLSQGSVATLLMCGGKHDNGFIANLMLSPTMPTIEKVINE